MKYLLAGYYGKRNLGDDVLLYVTIAEIAAFDPDAEFTVISKRDELVPPAARVNIITGGRRLETVRQLLKHDVWLFGGGGLLQDPSHRAVRALRKYLNAARVAKWLKKKIALVGIGVGPLTTTEGKRSARDLLRLADFVTLRDRASADLAEKLLPHATFPVTADLSFLFPKYVAAQAQNPGSEVNKSFPPTLGVSLLPVSSALGKDPSADHETAAAVAEALQRFLRQHPEWRIQLFEFFTGEKAYGDEIVLQAVQRAISMDGMDQRVSYRQYHGRLFLLQRDLAQCTAFFGMRLHSCVISWLSGVPCLMTDYHMKCAGIAASMGIGAEAILPVYQLLSAPMIGERLERLLVEPGSFLPRVSTSILERAAARNFTLLQQCLGITQRVPANGDPAVAATPGSNSETLWDGLPLPACEDRLPQPGLDLTKN